MQVYLRKPQAGTASHGYVWPHDGAVIPVEHRHAAELLKVRDAGYELVEPDNDGGDDSDDSDDDTFDEVDRVDDATDRPVRRKPGRPRKNPLPN